MAVLIFSDFRGFYEFGLISGISVLVVFAAMFLVLPAGLVLAFRWRMLPARVVGDARTRLVPGAGVTIGLLALVILAGLATTQLRFNYDFSSLTSDTPAAREAKERHRRVYSGFSAPAAVYVADDLRALDGALAELSSRKKAPEGAAVLGAISSARDVLPDDEEWAERRRLVAELRERARGAWTRRVEDPTARRLLQDLATFVPPEDPPREHDLPPEVRRRLSARSGVGWVLSVDTPGRSRDGKMTMAFTRMLYDTPMPAGVRGPTGDKPVLAEILWLVTKEAPYLVGAAFLGVMILVLLDRRSLVQTFWVLLPLVSGLVLCLGGMIPFGWRFNFFNIVVLPNLIGNAVDNGVHYYRRWEETGFDASAAQEELAGALTASVATTIMGYAGMLAAHHAGLRSIASLATWGLLCCWFSGVVLMPGVLALLAARARRSQMTKNPS